MSRLNFSLTSVDELFLNDEGREDLKREKVIDIPLSELSDFNGHPFKVIKDEDFKKLAESIKSSGVLSPAIARPKADGGYELISGHRRKAACEALGMDKLPVLVREMTDDEAVVMMVDSNIQRENLLPSEKAFAYKMKLEALKHQGKMVAPTSRQLVGKLETSEIIGQEANESGRQIQRYVRLTELHPFLLKMVDDKKIAFNPAVEISYITIPEQLQLYETMQREQATPSLSQAKLIKKLSVEKALTNEEISKIISELKGNQKVQCNFGKSTFEKYFPKSYTDKQMEETIIKLLSGWQRKEQNRHSQER